MKLKVHDFYEKLHYSELIDFEPSFKEFLIQNIPNAYEIKKTEQEEDKTGVDYWILRKNLPPIAIDVKNRDICPIMKFGVDDICIETTSVYTGPKNPPWEDKYRQKPGWTIDPNKRTDIIVYSWPTEELGIRRYWIVYFPLLCRASMLKWREWVDKYGEKASYNQNYLTLNVFVPKEEVIEAINNISNFSVLTQKTTINNKETELNGKKTNFL